MSGQAPVQQPQGPKMTEVSIDEALTYIGKVNDVDFMREVQ